MNTIKKFKRVLAFSLSILILYSSCTNQDELVNTNGYLIDKYSGEDIFKGIFFSEGDIIQDIPSLNRLKVKRNIFKENQFFTSNYLSKSSNEINLEEEITNRTNSLMKDINEINPKLFDETKEAVKSKNPDIVYNTLEKASLTIKTALYQDKKFEQGISYMKKAYEEGGIDPRDYDFSKEEDLKKYNNDMTSFLKNTKEFKNMSQQKAAAIVVVFYVTVVVLVAWGILVFAAVGGDVFLAYANLIFLWNWALVFDREKVSKNNSLVQNQLISDLIALNERK